MSTFTTTDGVALDYRVDGPADAADTLVMLHGWPQTRAMFVRALPLPLAPPASAAAPTARLQGGSQSGAMFDRALPLLSASTRVVTYDQRGHGASDKPDHGARIARLAADLPEP